MEIYVQSFCIRLNENSCFIQKFRKFIYAVYTISVPLNGCVSKSFLHATCVNSVQKQHLKQYASRMRIYFRAPVRGSENAGNEWVLSTNSVLANCSKLSRTEKIGKVAGK